MAGAVGGKGTVGVSGGSPAPVAEETAKGWGHPGRMEGGSQVGGLPKVGGPTVHIAT